MGCFVFVSYHDRWEKVHKCGLRTKLISEHQLILTWSSKAKLPSKWERLPLFWQLWTYGYANTASAERAVCTLPWWARRMLCGAAISSYAVLMKSHPGSRNTARNCCTSDMFPTLSAAARSANLISFFPLCAIGAKSWSTARTCPRSPLSSSSSTKRSQSSCGRCTVLSITRRPTCWRRSSSWMTTVMRVSAGVWGTSTGGVLISSRLRFAFLRSHAALRCVSFGCGDAAGSLQSDRVVLPLFCFFSFCSKNWNRIKPKLKSAITTDWNCN